ncbi:unnamed protein product, partial [Choristocarpus tenellus]
ACTSNTVDKARDEETSSVPPKNASQGCVSSSSPMTLQHFKGDKKIINLIRERDNLSMEITEVLDFAEECVERVDMLREAVGTTASVEDQVGFC